MRASLALPVILRVPVADRDGKVVLSVERLGRGGDVERDFLREAEIDRRPPCGVPIGTPEPNTNMGRSPGVGDTSSSRGDAKPSLHFATARQADCCGSWSGGWRASSSRKWARYELGHPPARRIAAHQRVEIILELADLVDRPFLRQRGEGVGGRAGAIIVERRRLAPERDVDGQRDLLDRREAVELVGAHVPRQVEQLARGRRTNISAQPRATSLLGSWQTARLLDRVPILRWVRDRERQRIPSLTHLLRHSSSDMPRSSSVTPNSKSQQGQNSYDPPPLDGRGGSLRPG